MANHTVSISLTLLVVAFAAAAATVSGLGGGGMVGGRTKVPNVKTNQEIQDLGRYSVEQYNHEQRTHNQKNGGDLKFQSVVEAETQVVAGTKYYLKISATDRNGVPQTFDAVLVVKPWVHSKQLVGFSPSPATK